MAEEVTGEDLAIGKRLFGSVGERSAMMRPAVLRPMGYCRANAGLILIVAVCLKGPKYQVKRVKVARLRRAARM